MQNNFYVYIYLDPRKPGEYIYDDLTFDYEPFYVGKGNRCEIHLYECTSRKSSIRYNKIKKIRQSGLEPIIIKLYENLEEKISFNLECLTIKKIGRKDLNFGPLINLSNGGEGESGYIFTNEHKLKLSNSLKNSECFQKACKSEEKKKKTSKSLKKFYETHIHHSLGKPKTQNEIIKIKDTMSIIYRIKTPDDNILEFKGTSQVDNYFKKLNEEKGLTSRFKVSPDAILYKNGSKGYQLIEKLNTYRNVKCSEEKKKKLSLSHSKTKNANSCLYKIKCPNGDILNFMGRENLRNYINEINQKFNLKIGFYG